VGAWHPSPSRGCSRAASGETGRPESLCSRRRKLRRGGSRGRERPGRVSDRGGDRARAATRRRNSEEGQNSRRGRPGTQVPGKGTPRNTLQPTVAWGAPEASKALLGVSKPFQEHANLTRGRLHAGDCLRPPSRRSVSGEQKREPQGATAPAVTGWCGHTGRSTRSRHRQGNHP